MKRVMSLIFFCNVLLVGSPPGNKWLCTVQNWLFDSHLKELLPQDQFFRKKATICSDDFCAQWTYVRFGWSWDTRLLFTFRVYTHISIIHSPVTILYMSFETPPFYFFERLFAPIDSSIFLSFWEIMWNPTRTNSFHS